MIIGGTSTKKYDTECVRTKIRTSWNPQCRENFELWRPSQGKAPPWPPGSIRRPLLANLILFFLRNGFRPTPARVRREHGCVILILYELFHCPCHPAPNSFVAKNDWTLRPLKRSNSLWSWYISVRLHVSVWWVRSAKGPPRTDRPKCGVGLLTYLCGTTWVRNKDSRCCKCTM